MLPLPLSSQGVVPRTISSPRVFTTPGSPKNYVGCFRTLFPALLPLSPAIVLTMHRCWGQIAPTLAVCRQSDVFGIGGSGDKVRGYVGMLTPTRLSDDRISKGSCGTIDELSR